MAILLPEDFTLEDAEISPDGSKLYFGSYVKESELTGILIHSIYQMDLNAGTPDAIEKTLFNLTTVPDREGCTPHFCYFITRTMQLGPDGKIYVSMRDVEGNPPLNLDVTASVIEEPNELAAKARYSKNALDIHTKYKFIQTNYIRSSTFTIKENGIQFQKKVCSGDPVSFTLLLDKVDSVRWDFGDPGSGAGNYSQSLKPQHTYPAPGTYQVKALLYNRCFTDTAFAQINIETDKAVKIPDGVKDSSVCTGNILFMDATTPFATDYIWGGGNTSPVQKITVSGKYEIKVLNQCSIDQKVFNVAFENCTCNVYVPNAFTPNGDGLNDVFRPLVQCFASDFRFAVYDRYGKMVFTTTEQGKGWKGNSGALPASNGVYVWTVQWRDPNNKQSFSQHGTVVLIH